ncbi:M1 family metallopeptidase [Gangjinia marincola]|uniref:Aminopeptidase N n=1 Tax=Gangjinia marincola TaxID=578463 RepID=A0ABN1MFN4_9FLAO
MVYKLFILLFFSFFGKGIAQQQALVDFQRIDAYLTLSDTTNHVSGRVSATFEIKKAIDSVYLNAKNITVYELSSSPSEENSYTLSYDQEHLIFKGDFQPEKAYTVDFTYSAKPVKALYHVTTTLGDQVWSQGQGKYTSNWLPSIDDMNDKIEFDLKFTAPKGFELVANGLLTEKSVHGDMIIWDFDMTHPMSSYLVAVAMGDYAAKEEQSASGVPMKFYYYPQDSSKVNATYRHSKRMFDFLEEEIGVAYPWKTYAQVPVKDFLYAGMENTSVTIFSDAFVVDEIGFNDQNYVNVNAHELAHQWFGDLVTETSGTHHWLHEGFASYYALLAEREIFGDDYYYFKLYESAERLKALSDQGKGEALLNPKASSLTFYEKGAWALHMLRERVGDEPFKKGVKNYLEKHAFKNVTTSDFLSEVENTSGMPLQLFREDWLEQSAFQGYAAVNSLKKSAFMQRLFELIALREKGIDAKRTAIEKTFAFPVNTYLAQEAVNQLSEFEAEAVLELYEKALATNDLYVRQAVAKMMNTIPEVFRKKFETLLNDESYVTQEAAFFRLWEQFPANRVTYFETMQGKVGLPNHNLELLWHALHLASDYKNVEKPAVLAHLQSFTAPEYAYQIRTEAFSYLYQFNQFSDQNLLDLAQASTHHVWRFRKDARRLMGLLVEDEEYQNRYKSLYDGMAAEERAYVTKTLAEL